MKSFVRIVLFIFCLVGIVLLVLNGYDYPWTGFGEYQNAQKEFVPAKSLWDWLDLLIVPIVLAVGAYLLDGSRKRSEQEVENDRQRQQVLDAYFSYISDLLLEKKLLATNDADPARNLARTQTLTALRLLDGRRKSQLLQFLYEAQLINSQPVIQLNGGDLSNAILNEATLSGAELRGVYFVGASIRRARLDRANLCGSDFSNVDFSETDLTGTQLVQANLNNAKLKTAFLENVDIDDVDLAKAKLTKKQREYLRVQKSGKG